MNHEIQTGFFSRAVRTNRLMILFVAALVVAPTVAYHAVRPNRYVAKIVLLVRQPKYQWRYDNGLIPIVDARRDYRREFLFLGQGRPMARRVAAKIGPEEAPAALLGRVSLRPQGTVHIVLEASGPSAEEAERLSLAWSEGLRAEVGERYGTDLEAENFARLRDEFKKQNDEARGRLEAFQAETGSGLFPPQFDTQSTAHEELRTKTRLLAECRVAREMVKSLLSETTRARQEGTEKTMPPMTELLRNPVLLQEVLPESERLPPQSDLAGWEKVLSRRSAQLDRMADWLEKGTRATQAALATQESRLVELQQDRNLATEALNTTMRKLNEIRAQQVADPFGVEMVDGPILTNTSSLKAGLMNAVAALGAGLVAGIWAALFVQHRREKNRARTAGGCTKAGALTV